MAALLSVQSLTLDYRGAQPKRLVDSLSFSLERGRSLALVGESGAGKSLTALAVMNLLPPEITRSGGCVAFEGRDLRGLSGEEMRRIRGEKIAIIMQNPTSAFDPVFTIRSHFAETLHAHEAGISAKELAERAGSALGAAGFDRPDEVLDIYPFQMSGGMLQRVMVALALVPRPELLIADEATTDLDMFSQKQILDLLLSERQKRNLSLLLVTHDLSVAACLADDVIIMHEGRAVENGPVGQIFSDPGEEYTRRLLGAHFNLYRDRYKLQPHSI